MEMKINTTAKRRLDIGLERFLHSLGSTIAASKQGTKNHIHWKIFKVQIIITMLLSTNIFSYGQSGAKQVIFYFPDSIKLIYAKHLLPPISGAGEEIVSYWSNYDDRDDQPEYTLRITKGKDNQHYLEGRFLTQCITKILTNMRIYTGGRYPIDVKLYSFPVSDIFTQNMRSIFVKTIDCKKFEKVFDGPWALDGVSYNFRIIDGNNEILESSLYEPEESNPCYKIIVLCKQMANDLKNNSFEESKYFDLLK
jgi:hypothetical protein